MTRASDVRAACGYPPKDPALNRRRVDPHPARIALAAKPTATVLPFQPRST